ncbi:sensor histidine kinase [Geothrix edaphica]|uniref:histidine kinase n=1 Tax=Geothrix edaphica TaxID=2927976 RepID=A0ABQ5PZK4_9BACT|nr:ATP-binding protein [Geothrix edaphica]GLH67816.1 two-component sensor histidine kinase [Geothrix edaphica]
MKRITRTLRFRLTAWYCIALAAGMVVFGGVLLGLAERHLMTNHDEAISLRGATALQILAQGGPGHDFTPWQTTRLARLGKVAIAQNLVGRDLVVYESPELYNASIMDRISALPNSEGEPNALRTFVQNGDYWRVLIIHRHPPGARHSTIWILEELGAVDATLKRLRLAFFHLVPVGLLVSFLGGYMLSGRALAPVTRIITLTKEIEAHSLDRRLPHPGVDDEIGRLVDTLNRMIGRLENAFEAMKRFTADASHELRSPLATIRNTIDVTLEQARTPQEQEAALRSVGEEVDRIRSLAEDLLLLARADSGRMVMQARPVDLAFIVEAQVEARLPQAEEWGLEVQVGPLIHDEILGDEGWLHQVVSNLLSNAIKYTPRGGKVLVDMARTPQALQVIVSDTGPGIPEEDLERIFDRFYRVDPSRTRTRAPGTGLGLAIAAWVVAEHHGTLRAANRPEGGATFTVTLPLGAAHA